MNYDFKACIKLLDEYIMYTTKDNMRIYIIKGKNNIIIANNNFKSILSIKDFSFNFNTSKFNIYKKIDECEDEIVNEHISYRQ